MTNRIDLFATTARIRQNMVWQTVIAAEKAAIAVFAAKNAKRRAPVLADAEDYDPLNSRDVFTQVERLDPSAVVTINTRDADAALLPYTSPVKMGREQFVQLVDHMIAKSGDKLFAGTNANDVKSVLYALASLRLEVAKLREHLTDRTYLSAVGFDTALAMFETADEQMTTYNTMLRSDVAKLGLNTKALSRLQGKVSLSKARDMLHVEQQKLQHMLNMVQEGKAARHFPNSAELQAFLAQHQNEIAEYSTARSLIVAELNRRNRPNTQPIYWEKVPEEIKQAAAKIAELRRFADKRALDSGDALYDTEERLEQRKELLKQQLVDILKPQVADLDVWLYDVMQQNVAVPDDPQVQALIREVDEVDDQLFEVQESIKAEDIFVTDAESDEDTALNQQILEYRTELFEYLSATFGVSKDELQAMDDSHRSDNLLEVFKASHKVVDPQPVTVTLDGSSYTLETNEELDTMLERVAGVLRDLKIGGRDKKIQQDMIDMQAAHIEQLKETIALMDLKNLFGSLKMTEEERKLFKFVKAAVLAEKERRLQAAKNPDVLENTDPDISFAMYGGKDHADNVAVDTRPLLNAYQHSSFVDFDYVVPQLQNLVLDPLRQTRNDFNLFESTPVDELLNRVSQYTAAKLGVKQRLLNRVEERLRNDDAFNRLHGEGLTFDEAQLRIAQMQAHLDLLDSNIEKLESAMLVTNALPIPDPRQSHPLTAFVQGLNKAVAFNKVKVGDTESLLVDLVDYQAAPLPLQVQLEQTFAPTTDLTLFVEYNPYDQLPSPLDALQKERTLVRLPHAASVTLHDFFVEHADDFWDKEYERLHRLAEPTEFPGPQWRPLNPGEKKMRMFYYRYNPEDGKDYVFKPPRQEPERPAVPPEVTDQTQPVESQPMPEPQPVPNVVTQPTPDVVSEPVPFKPEPVQEVRTTDARGTALAKGDKVSIGGLQDGTVIKVTKDALHLSVQIGDRTESRILSWQDVDAMDVHRRGSAESKPVPLKGEPIPNMKPAFLNPNVLVLLQSDGHDMSAFVGVDFSRPENAGLRDQLIRLVFAHVDAHRGDPDARKLLSCIPLKTEKGNLSPALVEQLVKSGRSVEDVQRMSEDSARSLLLHTKLSNNDLDPATTAQLRELGWSDADILGMAKIDAFRYLANKTRKPESTQDIEVKAQLLDEVTRTDPNILFTLRPQASVVDMWNAMRRTANHLRAQIKLYQNIKLIDTTANQKLAEQLRREVDVLGSELRKTTGDVGRVRDEPGLSPRESRYKGALATALGALREVQRRYQSMVQTNRDPSITRFLKQVQVDIDRYQTEFNGLKQKADAFQAKQELDKYVSNPESGARRLGFGLPTLEQFEDRPPEGFSKPSMDSLNIVPMDRSPEELDVTIGPAPKAAPKTSKPGRSSNQKPGPKPQKMARKPNLKLGKTMKLNDFLKHKR